MNRGDASGPCPRCGGPTECYDYDEAPWGARGSYTFSCVKCGMFGEKKQDPNLPATPTEYVFYNDGLNAFKGSGALPAPVGAVIRIHEGFEPGKLHVHEFTPTKIKLPAGATVLSEMMAPLPKRCLRCGRLTETCDSGLYGDCIDYRRR